MQDQAIRLCQAVGYRSAGTIEMLCDNNKNFYFLEMNTRLQVEHPITELISGEDLVELMIRVAAGEKLPQRFLDNPHVPFSGWAIESRVYAENPLRNFLPSIGPLNWYTQPPAVNVDGNVVRIDTGVFEGGVISMYYDPMIAKLATRGNDRQAALSLMEASLSHYVVDGLDNNLCFLHDVVRNKKFREGNYCTKFIGEEYPNGFSGVQLTVQETNELIATAVSMHQATGELRASGGISTEQPEERRVTQSYVAVVGGPQGTAYNVSTEYRSDGSGLDVKISPVSDGTAGGCVTLVGFDYTPGSRLARAFIDKEVVDPVANEYNMLAERFGQAGEEDQDVMGAAVEIVQIEASTVEGYRLRYKGSQQEVLVRTPLEHQLASHMLPPEKKDYSNMLRCPMPGTLISIAVEPGQHVVEGQELAVVEAMKMQNILRAPKNAVVKAVHCKAGSNLKNDQMILEYEP
ncbi:pccA [Symbiodinium microadriaticum]|nr:pccA [Symbiodinium microadriaticum]